MFLFHNRRRHNAPFDWMHNTFKKKFFVKMWIEWEREERHLFFFSSVSGLTKNEQWLKNYFPMSNSSCKWRN